MVSAAHQESIATTILDQLACTSGGTGVNRLRAMVEATNIVTLIAGATSEVVPRTAWGSGSGSGAARTGTASRYSSTRAETLTFCGSTGCGRRAVQAQCSRWGRGSMTSTPVN